VRLPGDAGANVLRTVDDARRLRGAFTPGRRLVIVGAGWIGAEVATAAAERGCAVTVVEASPTPLARQVGERIGGLTVPWYAERGIDLRCSSAVTRLDSAGVTLAAGERLPADLVLVAVGVHPQLDWLAGSGLELADGVVTDAAGRTARPGVYAVGDCARRWSPRAGTHVRSEHWDDALHAPTSVVTAILGGQAAYDAVPYFWSEQLGRRLQWVGWRQGDPMIWRGRPGGADGWAAAWLDETGRLRGFFAVDRPRDLLQARRAIDAGVRPDLVKLADTAVRVRDA
jgi:3-phenylpropionate/trans-cinnamate dioxygenase ferredoxin reductase subunit